MKLKLDALISPSSNGFGRSCVSEPVGPIRFSPQWAFAPCNNAVPWLNLRDGVGPVWFFPRMVNGHCKQWSYPCMNDGKQAAPRTRSPNSVNSLNYQNYQSRWMRHGFEEQLSSLQRVFDPNVGCRIGEAKVPGPFRIATLNVQSLNCAMNEGRLDLMAQDVLALTETCATRAVLDRASKMAAVKGVTPDIPRLWRTASSSQVPERGLNQRPEVNPLVFGSRHAATHETSTRISQRKSGIQHGFVTCSYTLTRALFTWHASTVCIKGSLTVGRRRT